MVCSRRKYTLHKKGELGQGGGKHDTTTLDVLLAINQSKTKEGILMSGPQTTTADRSINDLSQDHSSDKKFRGSSHEFDSTGLVQRCVIIQRDDNGFGLTVSGDNPVFVQLVKEDGAAMRAGVQKGDRIIKVNGTLVTSSNHLEVVKLIKSGSYVALTVLGRPPGSQLPLPEAEGDVGLLAPPHSTSLDQTTVPKRVSAGLVEGQGQKDPPLHSPRITPGNTPRNSLNSLEGEDSPDVVTHTGTGSPFSSSAPQIIGAEDDYFYTEQEQINGQYSCFCSIELLKSRPAHLAVFLHHVVSQFDPSLLLCYLYADLYKQTNSKETRRIFMEMHSFFMDRGANLKVPVPESISFELDRRRPELIPEELHRQYVQLLQDSLLPEVQRQLDDFRQKRSMGLTLAEGELGRLDVEQDREQRRARLDQERVFAENVVNKIEDVLLTSQATEEEKCITLQYVIFTYMKHLGVRVKEPRGLEPKRARITFLPKIKKRTEKEAEEKVKKPRFPSILGGPPRKPGRIDAPSGGRATDPHKSRPIKQLSQPALIVPEAPELLQSSRLRGNQPNGGVELLYSPTLPGSPSTFEGGGRDSDSALWKGSEGLASGDSLDNVPHSPAVHFSFNSNNVDQFSEDDRERERVETLGPSEMSEDDQGCEIDFEQDPPNWQQVVGREVLAMLSPHEIKRQEVINELFYTERAHLRMLKVMDSVFYQRLTRDGILTPADVRSIFANLEEIIHLHVFITEQMTAIRKKNETSVIEHIGDDLMSLFGGEEEEKMKQAAGTFCSNQPFALELIKSRQRRDQKFATAMQAREHAGPEQPGDAESNPLCRRLQLKDIIPVEMQRLTKYPLLLENIAKYTEDAEEREKVRKVGECCRHVLNHVNQVVKESENKQRLEDYQRRLDLSSLKQNENPMISELKNLDLTKRKMVHEGPLSWKVNKDKTIELYTLLLEDILVLLQKQDDRLVLRCHSKNLAGSADTKRTFSPVIKLSTVLVRSVATDNKSFFVLSMSENGAQIYELMAQTVSEQKVWQCLITQTAASMKTKSHTIIPLPQSDEVRDAADMIRSSKLSPDRTSTDIMQSSVRDADALPASGPNVFEEVKSDEGLDDGGQSFLDPDLADRLTFRQGRSHQGVAHMEYDINAFGLSPSRAEEALKSLAALRQLLVLQLSQEESERASLSPGRRLQRSTSLKVQTSPEWSSAHRRKGEGVQEVASLDTSSEDCYLVLEGFGDPGESSTDDDSLLGQKELREPAGSSDANPEKLLSSKMTARVSPDLIQQVLSHLHTVQVNLHHLKDVETKYVELCQRAARGAADTTKNKDKG
ncbi:rho guanine nucleotide exchange factor 12-like isoform X2 [Arapaima gigas]